jgi:hypothetical protein
MHEMSHVFRRDVLAQHLVHLTAMVYWFHPLVWLAVHRIGAEREQACDDVVYCVAGCGQRTTPNTCSTSRPAWVGQVLRASWGWRFLEPGVWRFGCVPCWTTTETTVVCGAGR